jgi:hypothetical protein
MTDENSEPDERTIVIPERTAKVLERRLQGTEFETVDDYATYALDQRGRELRRNQDETDCDDQPTETVSESTSDEAVEGRLESLGYL